MMINFFQVSNFHHFFVGFSMNTCNIVTEELLNDLHLDVFSYVEQQLVIEVEKKDTGGRDSTPAARDVRREGRFIRENTEAARNEVVSGFRYARCVEGPEGRGVFIQRVPDLFEDSSHLQRQGFQAVWENQLTAGGVGRALGSVRMQNGDQTGRQMIANGKSLSIQRKSDCLLSEQKPQRFGV